MDVDIQAWHSKLKDMHMKRDEEYITVSFNYG